MFYLEIPEDAAGTFWQASKMEQADLKFVNISNVLWFAERNGCSNAFFTASVINKNNSCITQLTSTANAVNLIWEVNENDRTLKYSNKAIVELPDYISSNAIITLTNGAGCSFTKSIATDAKYLRTKDACGVSAAVLEAIPAATVAPLLYPNPSSGIFSCMQNGKITTADEIVIYNTQGIKVGNFKNANQFNISNASAGLYMYQIMVKGAVFKGKLVKL